MKSLQRIVPQRRRVLPAVAKIVAYPRIATDTPFALQGTRSDDAIEAAGGAAESADLERVNLAGFLRDGDQIHVPAIEEEVTLATPSGGGIVNVNTATVEELDTLPGVGPALAERIIAYREANGPFADLAALDAVEGVGPALLEGIQELVVFE